MATKHRAICVRWRVCSGKLSWWLPWLFGILTSSDCSGGFAFDHVLVGAYHFCFHLPLYDVIRERKSFRFDLGERRAHDICSAVSVAS